MAIALTAFAPSFSGVYTAAAGTVNSVTATLISVTVGEAQPSMVILATPAEALAAGVAMGQAYCVTKGTVVIPFVNPTAGNVAVGDVAVKIVGL